MRLEVASARRVRRTREIERCHVVAGVFSGNPKAQRVIPFKVVHALASGRPVVTVDSPAVRRSLSPGIDCAVCAPADPDSIREALFSLATAAEFEHMAAAARLRYERSFSGSTVFDRLEVAFARVGVALHAGRGAEPAEVPNLAAEVVS